tara:strand:- start:3845 stop:5305 length:1461 start_codon:yes stop_codon:yes gene_type:complete
MSNVYTSTITGVNNASNVQGTSINNDRRIFNFGDRVAELAPAQSPFFTYLSMVAKIPTDDPVFKFLEQRHQWQRRNFQIETAVTSDAAGADHTGLDIASGKNLYVDCKYDKFGRSVTTPVAPEFLLADQILAIECDYDANASGGNDAAEPDAIAYYKVGEIEKTSSAKVKIKTATFLKLMLKPTRTADGEEAATKGEQDPADASKLIFRENADGQVIGSAFAEGTKDPEGWHDQFYNREGYCQIFKTAVPLFSGTALATRYRGVSNEYMRVYQEKLMEHKMDLEHAMLFGVGTDDLDTDGGGPIRRTHGIVPYTEMNGKVKTFAYGSANYDHFIDAMEDVFAPESGNSGEKLVLASRKVLSWLNKLGGSSFLGNTMSANSMTGSGIDMQNVDGQFGHLVTRVSTLYGNLNFVLEPLFRGFHEDTAIMIDLNNVAYRPLMGNGVSRDTQIITNVQDRDVDGRKDMILTEAGLEIQLPETHTVLKFNE